MDIGKDDDVRFAFHIGSQRIENTNAISDRIISAPRKAIHPATQSARFRRRDRKGLVGRRSIRVSKARAAAVGMECPVGPEANKGESRSRVLLKRKREKACRRG